jgi:fucose permease
MALLVDYPKMTEQTKSEPVNISQSLRLLKDPYAMAFSLGAFLYVAAESAIYVWMPTYLVCDAGSIEDVFACYSNEANKTLALYSISIFFSLRALGRFIGIWMMRRFEWTQVLMWFSLAILICFVGGLIGGKQVAVYLFPLSGVFMSVIYPTFNSKGISCFKKAQHGSVAGVILFFTAMGAAVGPFVMGVVTDAYGGDAKYGFIVATVFSAFLFIGLVYNAIKKPVEQRLREIELTEYATDESSVSAVDQTNMANR